MTLCSLIMALLLHGLQDSTHGEAFGERDSGSGSRIVVGQVEWRRVLQGHQKR